MSQLFHRNTNIYSRLSIVAALVFMGFLGWIVAMLTKTGVSRSFFRLSESCAATAVAFSR